MSQDLGALTRDPAVVAAILKSMMEEGREAKLKGFEQVREGGRGRLHVRASSHPQTFAFPTLFSS
eukprot:351395-Chlamydomonas_euryale.AAC.2